jgi:hypothetical protein
MLIENLVEQIEEKDKKENMKGNIEERKVIRSESVHK